jgi:2-C-methyl-D-erythritol 2,4-cyclodiphosphate synthase
MKDARRANCVFSFFVFNFLFPFIMSLRVGIGYDSHRLVAGRPLLLGGILVPFEKGLLGHSDGDVLLHAIGDAICGAAGLPDIGRLFPDTDEKWRGADSRELLREMMRQADEAGWKVGNVDAILIAQQPKISPHVEAMRACIAEILNVSTPSVNVRGKTAEGMGALGAGEGMAAHAICLLLAKN